jgi:hypothetical protein
VYQKGTNLGEIGPPSQSQLCCGWLYFGHGVSKSTYKQEPTDVELSGEVQGKAKPACLWSLASQTLLATHKTLHECISHPSATRKHKITKNNDAFVDD